MNRIIISILFAFCVCNLYSQNLSTVRTPDWNSVYQSGFYEGLMNETLNNPSTGGWYWGINTAHTSNSPSYRYNGQILFRVNMGSDVIPHVYVRSTDKNGVGTWARLVHSKGDHAIAGKLTVEAVEVKINTGADFVFEPTYNLKPLSEVETFVNENKHLPDIPSEQEMKENGLNLNEMQIKLLQKIEELTLYVIEQNKKIEELQNKVDGKK